VRLSAVILVQYEPECSHRDEQTWATNKIFTSKLTYLHVHEFKVCKSVHHRTIQINHQPDATIFLFIILTFIYSSTYFRRFLAQHQELNDCSGSLWFYLRIVVTVVLCSWSGLLPLQSLSS